MKNHTSTGATLWGTTLLTEAGVELTVPGWYLKGVLLTVPGW